MGRREDELLGFRALLALGGLPPYEPREEASMSDESHLDERYFIDGDVYNCPFCNRRNVMYRVLYASRFNWTGDKICYLYIVRCSSCRNRSMHLSYSAIPLDFVEQEHPSQVIIQRFKVDESQVLDELFFYSVPTSFFLLDKRVPRVLRELLTEAEGALKSNFLTGASACARKIVYELAKIEEATGDNYAKRIKSLKQKRTDVDGSYFDTLLTVQDVTSSKVHENAYDKWEARHVRLVLASLQQILHELYVVPALRVDRRREIESLRKEVLQEGVKTQTK